jgi:hypothetical protein
LITRTSWDEGATMLSRRIIIVSATIGMTVTMTWLMKVHGSHLNLKKMSQTKKE